MQPGRVRLRMSVNSLTRWLVLAAASVAAVAASVLVPSLGITAYAFKIRDAHATTDFALQVAEPLALAGALGATTLIATLTAPRYRDPAKWGTMLGAAAAAGMLGAAIWVNDVDDWTTAAVGLLPVAGGLSSYWTAKKRVDLPSEPAIHRPDDELSLATAVR
jgi:hypothetical protein